MVGGARVLGLRDRVGEHGREGMYGVPGTHAGGTHTTWYHIMPGGRGRLKIVFECARYTFFLFFFLFLVKPTTGISLELGIGFGV